MIKKEMSQKLIIIKTEILPKLKCHQNWYVTKTKMSPYLKCHQNWSLTKTELLPKLKCHKNWNVTKTEMSPNIIMSSKIKIKIKEIGTEYLGLVFKKLAPKLIIFSSYNVCLFIYLYVPSQFDILWGLSLVLRSNGQFKASHLSTLFSNPQSCCSIPSVVILL